MMGNCATLGQQPQARHQGDRLRTGADDGTRTRDSHLGNLNLVEILKRNFATAEVRGHIRTVWNAAERPGPRDARDMTQASGNSTDARLGAWQMPWRRTERQRGPKWARLAGSDTPSGVSGAA